MLTCRRSAPTRVTSLHDYLLVANDMADAPGQPPLKKPQRLIPVAVEPIVSAFHRATKINSTFSTYSFCKVTYAPYCFIYSIE